MIERPGNFLADKLYGVTPEKVRKKRGAGELKLLEEVLAEKIAERLKEKEGKPEETTRLG